jgi:hypothetical protein
MKIRINHSRYWYKAGEVFTLLDEKPDCEGDYRVAHPKNSESITYLVCGCDCVIISEEAEDLTNITVIKDEAIGGLLREYTEVKRKAAVGEKVRVYGHTTGLANGIFTVTKLEDGDIRYMTSDGQYGTPFYDGKAYVTLEPTDIVRIGSERLRLVERKANVGERIVITKGSQWLAKGVVITVHPSAEVFSHGQINLVDGEYGTFGAEYRVLEPLKSAHQPSAPDIAQEDASLLALSRKINEQAAQIDGLTDAVAKLTRKVSELDCAKPPIGAEELPTYVSVASGPVIDALPSFANRDDVITKAKRDVAELERTSQVGRVPHLDGGTMSFYPRGNDTDSAPCDEVEFVVNCQKRTVVALIRWIGSKRVWARGIAKCAPGECFNVHIGRAIGLRRALGLEVPAEYTNAPGPRDPRVGDIVIKTSGYVTGVVRTLTEKVGGYNHDKFGHHCFNTDEGDGWIGDKQFEIIDDSRTGEDEEVAE